MKIILRALSLFGSVVWLSPIALAQNTPQATAPAPSITVVDAATTAKLIREPGVVLLDVRTPAEFATGHLEGAQNLDFRAPDFAQQIAELDPAKTYVLYCASGNRSSQAGKIMQEKGLQKVVNAGAFKTLKASGLKTEE